MHTKKIALILLTGLHCTPALAEGLASDYLCAMCAYGVWDVICNNVRHFRQERARTACASTADHQDAPIAPEQAQRASLQERLMAKVKSPGYWTKTLLRGGLLDQTVFQDDPDALVKACVGVGKRIVTDCVYEALVEAGLTDQAANIYQKITARYGQPRPSITYFVGGACRGLVKSTINLVFNHFDSTLMPSYRNRLGFVGRGPFTVGV